MLFTIFIGTVPSVKKQFLWNQSCAFSWIVDCCSVLWMMGLELGTLMGQIETKTFCMARCLEVNEKLLYIFFLWFVWTDPLTYVFCVCLCPALLPHLTVVSPPVLFRVLGLRISLSSMLTICPNFGRSALSLCQQSSISWWSATGQSMGGGSR